ncbi:MAG: hypothetical protein KGI82_00600 [Betaproteobacteria bacterium]|nr:hypothetical protein [Betaproteobacteria bacterium]
MTLTPILTRCAIPNRAEAEARALTVRMALTETLLRWRRDLTAAELALTDAVEADADEFIEPLTDSVEQLRQGILHLTEELSL